MFDGATLMVENYGTYESSNIIIDSDGTPTAEFFN